MGSHYLYSVQPPEFLIEGLLPKQTITGITSSPGVGKTWLVFEMMRALTLGEDFLGKFPTKKSSCLFVGSDASIHDYARQWRKLTYESYLDHCLSEEEIAARELSENPYDYNVKFLLQSDFKFENLDVIRQLISTSRHFSWCDPELRNLPEAWEEGFSLIIFDTLSALTECNQDNNTEMQNVFRNIRLLAEATGSGLIILHHNSYESEYNDGERWRGASAQIGALDNWFQLSPDKNNKNLIQFKVKRFRGLTPDPFFYQMEITEDSTTIKHHEQSEALTKFDTGLVESMRDYLIQFPGRFFTVKQLSQALFAEYSQLFGGREDRFAKAVRHRLEENLKTSDTFFQKSGGGSRGSTAFYSIKESLSEQNISRSSTLPLGEG
jgi:hypothetical protein